MFTRKAKRNYRIGIFSTVIVCFCILIAALAWPQDPVETTDANAGLNPDYEPQTEPEGQNGQLTDNPYAGAGEDEGEDGEDEDFVPGEGTIGGNLSNASENEENSMNPGGQSYYLVKRAGEQIVVYFCDGSGNMVQLETTDILYGMLGPEDQKLFDQGIQAASQEELSVLLQDFES